MFPTLVTLALFAIIAIQGALADFTVATPQITQCKPVQLTWDQTKGPYNLLVVPGDDPCDEPLADLGDHDENHMTWTNKLPAGTKVMLSVLDANEDEGWSGEITVGESTDDSCLPGKSSGSIAASSTTTLVVPPTGASGSSTTSVAPVGAAGADPLSGSNGASALAINTMALTAVVAAIALSL
jgi:hypothetical protein